MLLIVIFGETSLIYLSFPANESTLGRPRDNNSYWIGHILPDDQQLGYDATDFLLTHNNKPSEQLTLLAINGSRECEVAAMRACGLIKRLNENKAVSLLQILYTDWTFMTNWVV